MRAYELMVLIDPEIDERTVEPTLRKYLDAINKDGGTVDELEVWGRRRLAYEIQKKNEAIYAVVNFTATPEQSQELDRQLGLNETVMRTKIIRPEDQKITLQVLVPLLPATHRSASWPENHISLWLATWQVTQNCGLPQRDTRLQTLRLLRRHVHEINRPVNGLMMKRCGFVHRCGVKQPKTWQRR